MNEPGPGFMKATIEYLVGSTGKKELQHRRDALALYGIACLKGNLRILTWTWDKRDPAMRHCPEMLYIARDLMQKVLSYLFPREYGCYGEQENQYSQAIAHSCGI